MSANPTHPHWLGAGLKPASWSELKKSVAAAAEAHGIDSSAAVDDLERGGPLAQLMCAQLGIELPLRAKKKTGPKAQEGFDSLLVGTVDSLRSHEGLKGEALFKRAHFMLDNTEGFFSEKRSVTWQAMEQRYYRLKRAAKS